MHDRLADGSPVQSAKLSSHRHPIRIGGHVPPLLGRTQSAAQGEAMHDRLADGWAMQSAKLSSHRHPVHIGGHVPPLKERRCMIA